MKNKTFSIFLIFISVLMLATVASAGKETQLTNGERLTQRTAVFGNHVFWTETTANDVHTFDLTAGKRMDINGNGMYASLVINSYGNKVVWTGDDGGAVYMYDISTGNETKIASGRNLPDVYGNYIVYTNTYNDDHQNDGIYLYDLNAQKETKIATVYSSPAIYDTKVVWSQANSNNGYDIREYDRSTHQTSTITSTNSSISESGLDIYGNIIVWIGSGNVYMYDIASHKTTQVTNSGNASQPAIYGNRIVYTICDRGDLYTPGHCDIYMYEISTAKITRITTSTCAFGPSIYGDKIVYADSRNYQETGEIRDIYLYDLNSETEKLKALFITDVTSGIAPLNVSFTDTSTGTPNAWSWDFGDGVNSTKQNPIHTYVSARNYTARLTVSNANGTDSKLAAITVSEKPVPVLLVANFSSNVTSGYAPLSVKFTDLSTKVTGWNWNFGDGTTSTDQNPTHIYSVEGTYFVNLTISNEYGYSFKIDTITVRHHPVYAYVANFGSNTTSVIDTTTNKVIATVNVGTEPWGITVSPDGSKVYVTNNDSNTVSVIDTAAKKVTATINVGNKPGGVAVTPDGTKVYVANSLDNTTSVIDTATNTVTATVPVDSFPTGVAVTPDGTKVYVTSATYTENSTSNSTVSVIDTITNTVAASVPVGTASTGVAVTPDGTKVYVANSLDNTISVIDTGSNTVIATVSVGTEPWGIAVSPDGTNVYVANCVDNTTSVIDAATNTVKATVPVGLYPVGVSITPDGKEVYVTNSNDDTVSVIDTATNKVKTTVNVGEVPCSFGQFIEQPVSPVANFNSNVSEGYAPLTVQFTDLSKNVLGWNWNFGDGGISTDQNPIHTYSATGTYNVNLTVSNAKGIASKTGAVTVMEGSGSSGGSSGGDGSSSGSSHSSGGSGSGGAGGSTELQSNVEIKELSQAFIASGQSVKFDFPQKATSVVYVSFDSKKTAGKTTTIAEMLKSKSTRVSELPADEIYKHMNIWVGNSGYATEKNIENAVVCFKVEKSWIQDKNIDKSSITLSRYRDKTWNKLPTSLSNEDNNYLYYTAQTPGFSPFTITGKTTAKEAMNDTQTKPNAGNATANAEQIPEQKLSSNTSGKQNTKAPGFEMASGIICLLCIFLYKKR